MDLSKLALGARTELSFARPIFPARSAIGPILVPETPTAATRLIGVGGRPDLPSEARARAAREGTLQVGAPILDSIHATLLSMGSRYLPTAQALVDVANGEATVLRPSQLQALAPKRAEASARLTEMYVDAIETGSMPRAPRTEHNKVDLLVRNAEYLPRLRADLEAATKSITVNQFSWEPDGAGEWVAKILADKARAGLDVRVVIDGYGVRERSGTIADNLERQLTSAGVRFVRTDGFNPWGNGFEHRKLITVDDRVAYTGGLGFGAKYDSWTDLMMRVEGPAGTLASADALNAYREISGAVDEALPARAAAIRTQLREAHSGTGRLAVGPPRSGPLSDARAAVTLLDNRPGHDLAATEAFLRDAAAAKERLWATSTYITTPVAANALMDASRRGVDVKLLVTGPLANNDGKQVHLGRSRYAEMIDAGVEVYEYPSILHAKSWLRDDDITSVGSMNLSQSSMARSREITARVEDHAFAKKYARFHEQTRAGAQLVRKEDVQSLELRALASLTNALNLHF